MATTDPNDPRLSEATEAQLEAQLDRLRMIRAMPGQVSLMTTQYLAGGGDRRDLTKAVTDAPNPEPSDEQAQ